MQKLKTSGEPPSGVPKEQFPRRSGDWLRYRQFPPSKCKRFWTDVKSPNKQYVMCEHGVQSVKIKKPVKKEDMMEQVVITLEKLKELCSNCFKKFEKRFGEDKIKTVKISKSDYNWLVMEKNDRPPKDWWDRCIESVGDKADDSSALCGWIWSNKGDGDDEAIVPPTEDAIDAVKEKMKADECVAKMRKDIDMVMEWRKSGKPLTKEQQGFADRVVDDMIGFRVAKQAGVQLVSKANFDFIKGQQPIQGSDAVAGITQDVVSNTHSKDGKYPRKTEEDDVEKVAKPKGVKPKEVPISEAETGTEPRKSADIANQKLNPPDNHDEGAVTDTAQDEKIGHNPNQPMPRKIAEDLIANAKWGVEIGAYTTVKEGIERQLGRKSYAEFVDTAEKYKDVTAYLLELGKEG